VGIPNYQSRPHRLFDAILCHGMFLVMASLCAPCQAGHIRKHLKGRVSARQARRFAYAAALNGIHVVECDMLGSSDGNWVVARKIGRKIGVSSKNRCQFMILLFHKLALHCVYTIT
jgi:hypothetical protein